MLLGVFKWAKYHIKRKESISKLLWWLIYITLALFGLLAITERAKSDNEISTTQTEVRFTQGVSVLELSEKKIEIIIGESYQQIKKREQNEKTKNTAYRVFLADVGVDWLSVMQNACEGTQTDWRLVYAIGVHESGFTYTPGAFNYFGRKDRHGGWLKWDSPESAARDQCEYIEREYLLKGLFTPEQMSGKYAEASQSWARSVRAIMVRLEGL